MGKKKRKKKPPSTRPASPSQTPEEAQGRQERKEAARREREARIKRARRRQRTRKLVRWLVVFLVLGLIAGFIWWRGAESRRVLDAAEAAAREIGCEEIQELESQGQGHEPPYEYTERPATSGAHAPNVLDPAISVYDDPIDQTLEPQAVHNLEHAYVIMYYRNEGPEALPENVRAGLAELAESQDKVILAPFPDLPEGTSLTFAAWRRVQHCPQVNDPGSAEQVARGFIQRFRSGGVAPEPTAV